MTLALFFSCILLFGMLHYLSFSIHFKDTRFLWNVQLNTWIFNFVFLYVPFISFPLSIESRDETQFKTQKQLEWNKNERTLHEVITVYQLIPDNISRTESPIKIDPIDDNETICGLCLAHIYPWGPVYGWWDIWRLICIWVYRYSHTYMGYSPASPESKTSSLILIYHGCDNLYRCFPYSPSSSHRTRTLLLGWTTYRK